MPAYIYIYRSMLFAMIIVSNGAFSDPALIGDSLFPWDEDIIMKEKIEKDGIAEVGTDVVAWFPGEGIQAAQRKTLVAMLDKGVAAVKKFIGNPQWSFTGDSKIYFYFPDEKFIAHAPGGNTVFIPLWRIVEDEAPWLHEAVHLLVQGEGEHWLGQSFDFGNERMPLWLFEGIADYIAMEVSANVGLQFYSPLSDVPKQQLNSQCKLRLDGSPSEKVLETIGARGRMPELFGPNRFEYALPFYNCSTAFVYHLGNHYGPQPLLKAIQNFDREVDVLEEEVGKPLADLKQEWLSKIYSKMQIK